MELGTIKLVLIDATRMPFAHLYCLGEPIAWRLMAKHPDGYAYVEIPIQPTLAADRQVQRAIFENAFDTLEYYYEHKGPTWPKS